MELNYAVTICLLTILLSVLTTTAQRDCPFIVESGRQICGGPGISRDRCQQSNCCWDRNAKSVATRCYTRECKPGNFGWGCRFTCNCMAGDVCNQHTGACKLACPDMKWGVGCMLMSMYTYNDDKGVAYMGRRDRTSDGHRCATWADQNNYDDHTFPRRSRHLAGNYCRNPTPNSRQPWCYKVNGGWGYCRLRIGNCVRGRFGINCQNECHCASLTEKCGQTEGHCRSGCHAFWDGPACQRCAAGRFGIDCHKRCNCHDTDEVCDSTSGKCDSGCADGYGGPGCDLELPRLTRAPQKVERNMTSVMLRWDAWSRATGTGNGPVTRYVVYYRGVTMRAWRKRRTTETTITIDGLLRTRFYRFKVVPVHALGFEGRGSPELSMSTCGKPTQPPQDVKIDIDDATLNGEKATLIISWKRPPVESWNCDRITKYRVYHQMAPGSYREDTTTLALSVLNVNVSRNYTARVALFNDAGLESGRSPVATFVGRRGRIENLVIQSTSSSSIHVKWSPPRWSVRVDHYMVAYRLEMAVACDMAPDEPLPWSQGVLVSSRRARVHELSGLLPYRRYTVRVWAVDGEGRGGHPLQDSAITQPAVPADTVSSLLCTETGATMARFTWHAPRCDRINGPKTIYRYELRANDEDDVTDERRGETDVLELTLKDIIPYTRYTLSVWLANSAGDGPRAHPIMFRTLEDTPPAPRAVQTEVLTADTLAVTWMTPRPTHGIITGYTLRIHRSPRKPDEYNVGPTVRRYEVGDLLANTSYRIEVRASTAVGPGEWSKSVYGFSEEGVPDAPSNVNNVSRTATTIGLRWSDPHKSNGRLRKFKILCHPAGSTLDEMKWAYTSSFWRKNHKELLYPAHDTVMTGLQPGSRYVCEVRASTKRGYGDAVSGTYWTAPPPPEKPDPPTVKLETQTDTTVEIELLQLRFNSILENAQSTYQVVVEELAPSYDVRTRRSVVTTPCGLPPSELVGHAEAMRKGLACYVAAAMPASAERRTTLVIGDGMTDVDGYYNAPLNKGHVYDIWFGSQITVDGVTTATYSKAAVHVVATQYKPAPQEGNSVALGAGIGAAIAILLVVGIVLILVLRKKREWQQKKAEASQIEDLSIGLSTQVSEDPHKAMLPDICADDESPECATPSTSLLFGNMADNNDDDSARHQRPVAIDDLDNYVKLHRPAGPDSLVHEFDEMPHGLRAKCLAAMANENKQKNRYGNIIAYDHSRVVLDGHQKESHQGYINANFIDAYRKPNAYIATQGPSKHTANDLWKMAWQHNSHRIVMVTNLVEDGRRKCEQYWPEDSPVIYGGIEVTKTDQEYYADFTIRSFTMTLDRVTKSLRQFHFTSWPDHGVPLYAISLLAFRKKVRAFDDPTAGPTIVHCSAGVGRTGTFIALDCLLDQAKVEGQVDVCNAVYQMRRKRVNMVQTQEQYVFVYDALLEALRSGDTAVACADFPRRFAELLTVNPATGNSRMFEEYELLLTVSPQTVPSLGCKDALEPENVDKNRNMQVLPLDKVARPFIQTYIPLSNDYINAVFVDGYKQRDAFIITQMPLPNTINDFWAMMYDHQCKTIVMMNELNTQDASCACYYPDQGITWSFGPFSVKTTAIDSLNPDVTIRDMTLSYSGKKQSKSAQVVRHFQYHGWPERLSLPANLTSIMSLLSLVERWQQRSGNRHIVVHCMDGATQSGLFCAVSYLVERLKVEQEVDTFQSVIHSRINRPQLIPTLEQYHFLYEVAREYMDSFGTYANFK